MKNTKKIIGLLGLLSLTVFMVVWGVLPKQKNVSELVKQKLSQQELKKARGEYFLKMLQDPKTKEIPANARARELKFSKDLEARKSGLKTSSAINYVFSEAGFSNIGGRTRALAYDARDTTIMLAAGVSGGIFRSTDGGDSWYNVSDPSTSQSVTSIAQDPTSQDTWYAVGGELDGSAQDIGFTAFYYGVGLYKSTDNGENWTLQTYSPDGSLSDWVKDGVASTTIPTSFDANPFRFAHKIAVNPTNGDVYFTSFRFGIMKSTDGADNFTTVLPLAFSYEPSYSDIVITSTGTLIATTSTASGGVFRSVNDGTSWSDITPSGFINTTLKSLLALAPSDNDILYVFSCVSSANYDLYQIDLNGGGATSDTDYSSMIPNYAGNVGTLTQGSYNMILAVKPSDPDFVVVGATNLYRIADITAGTAPVANDGWVGGYSGVNDISQYENHHPDQQSFFFNPSTASNTAWSGHDGGLSKTTDITITGSQDPVVWQDKNLHYNVAQYYDIKLPADNGDMRFMGGTQDNGTLFGADITLFSDEALDGSSGDGSFSAFGETVSVTSAQNAFILRMDYGGAGDVDFSQNAFRNVTVVKPSTAAGDVQFIHPFALDPNDEDFMYYPDGNTLWRQDQLTSLPFSGTGQTQGWTQMTGATASANYDITAIEIATDVNTVYYGAYRGSNTPEIYKLESANTVAASASATDITPPGLSSGAYLHDIAVNPADGDEVIIVFSNYGVESLYYTSDGGSNWSAIQGDLGGADGPSIRSASIHTYGGNTCYLIGTSIGLYATSTLSGGTTSWTKQAASLVGNTIVNALDSRNSDGAVVIGTHGRGAFLAVPSSTVNTPTITSFTPEYGAEGETVIITGTNFTMVSKVEFNGINAPIFTVNSATEIEAIIPANANSGQISVTTAGGTATSAADFIYIHTTYISDAWDNGAPTTIMNARISDDYDAGSVGSFVANHLIVEATHTLTIQTNTSVSISSDLRNAGTIVVKDNSAFVQTATTPSNSGTGTYTAEREGTDNNRAYNYWSSPVQNTTINGAFASGKNFYTFTASTQSWAGADKSAVLSAGLGFIGTGTAGTPTTIVRSFSDNTGFNSGTINYAIFFDGTAGDPDENWNLVGNPYPSGLDVNQFLTDNTAILENAVYLWSSDGNDFASVQADYATMNAAGTIGAGGSGVAPSSATVASAQGFFVQTKAAGNIAFNNSQRVSTNNTFQKINKEEWKRIWLGVEAGNGATNEILIGFMPDAEEGKDRYDAIKFSGNSHISLYSIGEDFKSGKKLVIQGLPTLSDRTIPIGIEAKTSGEFTFNINYLDGFTSGSKIILHDKETGSLIDLNKGSYTVNLEKGEYNERFSLRFIDADNLDGNDFEQMGITLFSSEKQVNIQFANPEFLASTISIYDISGRLITAQSNKEKKAELVIPVQKSGIFIVTIQNVRGIASQKLFVR